MKKTVLSGVMTFLLISVNPGWAQELAAKSKIFPINDEGLTCQLIEGSPNLEEVGYPLPETVKMDKEKSSSWTAIIEVPVYLDFLDATHTYSGPMPAPLVSDVMRAGKPYNRYQFKGLFLGVRQPNWALFFSTWTPRPAAEDRASPGVFAWHFVTPEGAEKEQVAAIRLLPPLSEARPPRRVHVRFWTCSNANITPSKLEPILSFMRKVGVTDLGRWESSIESLEAAGIHEKGMRLAGDQAGANSWPAMGTAKTDNPDYQNRDHLGRPLSGDPQWILDEKGKPWEPDLQWCQNEARRLEVLSQDIEWGPVWDNGFSPAGIKAFAARFGLSPEKLTPAIIWAEHRQQWGDFRAEQTLALHKLFYDAAKAGNPKVRLVALPGGPYLTTDANLMSDMIELEKDSLGRMSYLIFPFPTRRLPEAMDVLQPMWYGHGGSQVKDAFNWSRAISSRIAIPLEPIFYGQGREFYFPGGDSGETLRAIYWAALLGGAKGYGAGWQCEFSPLQFSWIAKTNREISRLEDILLDGKPDSADVTVTPMPKKHFTLIKGTEKKVFPVPDFNKVTIYRAFTQGERRLLGLINIDQGNDVYYKVVIAGLTTGNYRVLDVSEGKLLTPNSASDIFTEKQLAEGFTMMTPAKCGVRLLLIAPAVEFDHEKAERQLITEYSDSYIKYRTADTEGAVLAERDKLSIRYDMIDKTSATAILVESPVQQVWIRPQDGGVISDWRIKEGNRTLSASVNGSSQFYSRGIGTDLFWSPADAHWSGDEKSDYELVDAKIHGSKAWVRLRQTKQTPSLQGLILTKTIVVPLDRADIEIKINIENAGPAPLIGFSFWAHHMVNLAAIPAKPSAAASELPQVFMQTVKGVTEAPVASVVWTKPNEPFIAGNEMWERTERNGITTGEWIAERNPATGEAVLCQVDQPAVAQIYSCREANNTELSLEWMYPLKKLPAGESWSTSYTIRYLKAIEPSDLTSKLLPQGP